MPPFPPSRHPLPLPSAFTFSFQNLPLPPPAYVQYICQESSLYQQAQPGISWCRLLSASLLDTPCPAHVALKPFCLQPVLACTLATCPVAPYPPQSPCSHSVGPGP